MMFFSPIIPIKNIEILYLNFFLVGNYGILNLVNRLEYCGMNIVNVFRIKTHRFWDSINVIRASILGANDGIISISGIVLGATGANLNSKALFISGLMGTISGACSMAGGEWISVSAQRDIQLKTMENHPQTLKQTDLLMPIHAAISSFLSFFVGALIPLLAMTLADRSLRIIATLGAMLLALALNATISTHHANVSTKRMIIRNIIVGLVTTLISFSLGASI